MTYKVIALAPNPWNGLWMNRQQLLSRLGKWHPVVYSNGAWESWEVLSKRWIRSPLVGMTVRDSGVDVDVNGLFDVRWRRFPYLDRLAVQRVCRRWRRALARFDVPLVAHIFYPNFLAYVDDIRPDVLVYHVYDLYACQPGWDEESATSERKLLDRADAVIAASDDQATHLERICGKHVHRLYNGVDCAAFASTDSMAVPSDVARIPRPRIGYMGRVNRKVDLPLLVHLARARPDWNVVIVGPVSDLDDVTGAAYERLSSMSNVHFLGARGHDQLGRYVESCDVNLMCYRLDGGWARFGYPLKMHEYFASGVPVVSSKLSAVLPFAHLMSVVDSPAEWEVAIDCALRGTGPSTREERRKVAAENDWEVRAKQLDEIFEDLVQGARHRRVPI